MIRCSRCGKPLQAETVTESGNPHLPRAPRFGVRDESPVVRRASDIDAQMGDLFCSLVLPRDWKQSDRAPVCEDGGAERRRTWSERRSRLGRRSTADENDKPRKSLQARGSRNWTRCYAWLRSPRTIELDEVAELLGGLPEPLWIGATGRRADGACFGPSSRPSTSISGRKRIVGIIAPVPALQDPARLSLGSGGPPGCPAVLIDPDEVGETQSYGVGGDGGESNSPSSKPSSRICYGRSQQQVLTGIPSLTRETAGQSQ